MRTTTPPPDRSRPPTQGTSQPHTQQPLRLVPDVAASALQKATGQRPPVERLLSRKEVEERLQVRKTWIYEQIKNGLLARPVRLGHRTVRWKESDIEAYIASLSADSSGSASA